MAMSQWLQLVSPQELKDQDHVSIHHILCSIPSPNIKEDSIPPKGDTINLQNIFHENREISILTMKKKQQG